MKVTASIPATAKAASKPGVVVVVVDLLVVVGSVAGVELVVVVVDLASLPGAELVHYNTSFKFDNLSMIWHGNEEGVCS